MLVADVLRVVGGIAGIGGISLGILLLVYRDLVRELIRVKAFRELSSTQATVLLGGVVTTTFVVATLGIFAGLAASAGAVPFIVLVGLFLVFGLAVLLVVIKRSTVTGAGLPVKPGEDAFARVGRLVEEGRLDEADRLLARAGASPDDPDPWYWRARVALARDNIAGARACIDEALARAARDEYCVALKIKLLLLGTRRADRAAAQTLAAQSRGISAGLDAWLSCLTVEGLLGAGIRTATEMDLRCPPPAPDRPSGQHAGGQHRPL